MGRGRTGEINLNVKKHLKRSRGKAFTTYKKTKENEKQITIFLTDELIEKLKKLDSSVVANVLTS